MSNKDREVRFFGGFCAGVLATVSALWLHHLVYQKRSKPQQKTLARIDAKVDMHAIKVGKFGKVTHQKPEQNLIKSKKLSRKDLRKIKTSLHKSRRWLTCEDIVVAAVEADYRKMVESVLVTDNVIELGCHEGVTTQLIARRGCAFVLGVDKSSFSIQRARQRVQTIRNSNTKLTITFVEADANDTVAVRGACKTHGLESVSVIFIDVRYFRHCID